MLANELHEGDTLDGVGPVVAVHRRANWTRVSLIAQDRSLITFDLPAEMPVLATRPEKPSEVRPRRQQPSEPKRKSPIPILTKSGPGSVPSSDIGERTDLLPTTAPEQ